MLKVMLVLCTRPAAIKMAPLIKLMQQQKNIETLVCVTGQHRQMLDQVLEIFDLKPDIDFNIMQASQTLYDISANLLKKFETAFQENRPDWVFVQGDTSSSFIAALAAFYQKIPVAHVEAGLRTYNKYSPFPEEMNRQFISKIAQLHFVPTVQAQNFLLKEGIPTEQIFITGNTVIDALLHVVNYIKQNHFVPKQFPEKVLDYAKNKKPMILITGHRRENFGQKFETVCKALAKLATNHPDWLLVYPVHLNPNVQEPVRKILSTQDNICLLEPLDYLSFVYLMSHAKLIITDSGGVQEEAPSLGIPVVVTRETTERNEGVAEGAAILVGCDYDRIIQAAEKLMANPEKLTAIKDLYGDGKAAQAILNEFLAAALPLEV